MKEGRSYNFLKKFLDILCGKSGAFTAFSPLLRTTLGTARAKENFSHRGKRGRGRQLSPHPHPHPQQRLGTVELRYIKTLHHSTIAVKIARFDFFLCICCCAKILTSAGGCWTPSWLHTEVLLYLTTSTFLPPFLSSFPSPPRPVIDSLPAWQEEGCCCCCRCAKLGGEKEGEQFLYFFPPWCIHLLVYAKTTNRLSHEKKKTNVLLSNKTFGSPCFTF